MFNTTDTTTTSNTSTHTTGTGRRLFRGLASVAAAAAATLAVTGTTVAAAGPGEEPPAPIIVTPIDLGDLTLLTTEADEPVETAPTLPEMTPVLPEPIEHDAVLETVDDEAPEDDRIPTPDIEVDIPPVVAIEPDLPELEVELPPPPCKMWVVDDHFTVNADTTALFPAGTLQANDSGWCGLPVRLENFADHGIVVSHDGPGGFSYTPDPGYVGPDSFQYDVMSDDTDGALVVATATVELDVVTIGTPPVETPDVPADDPWAPIPAVPFDDPAQDDPTQTDDTTDTTVPNEPTDDLTTEDTVPEDTTPEPTEPTAPETTDPTPTTEQVGSLPQTGADTTVVMAVAAVGLTSLGLALWRIAARRRPQTA